jgi:hypothetical protein
MATTIVNGYLCTSSCDVAKAKKGENPHPSTDATGIDADKKGKDISRADKPAVLYGGSLRNASGANRVEAPGGLEAAGATGRRIQEPAVDLRV